MGSPSEINGHGLYGQGEMVAVLWSLMPEGQWDDDCFVVLWSLMPDGQMG